MPQLRAGPAFAEKALPAIGRRIERRPHDLDRDLVAKQWPRGAIDRPHAALADGADDFVAPVKDGAGGEHAD